MDDLFLQTLGDLALRRQRNGEERLIGPSKSLAVLAYLAATPGREAARDHVARLLWPGFERSRARRSLRQALYYLSQSAGRDLVVSTDGDMAVAEDALDVDLWRFERALQRADYERAVALYEGPFLDGFSVDGGREFEGWAETRNERVWSGLKAAYHELVTDALEAGEAESAVRHARGYVELNPFDESAREVLIRAHLARGDRVAAYRAYEEYRRLLEQELDEQPADELRARVEGLEEDVFRWSVDDVPEVDTRGGASEAAGRAGGTEAGAAQGGTDGGTAGGTPGPSGADPESRSAPATSAAAGDAGDRPAPGDGTAEEETGWRAAARPIAWALAGGAAAAGLIVAGLVVSGWLPMGASAGVTPAWSGADGEVEALVRTADGPRRASVTIRDGEGRLEWTGVEPGDLLAPDGVTSARDVSGSGGPDVRLVDGNGGGVEREISTRADEHPLAWSPDGRRLLLQAGWLDEDRGEYRRRLRVLDRTTGEVSDLPVALPTPEKKADEAAWSPTGLRIAVVDRTAEGDRDVFVMGADGTRFRPVTRDPGRDAQPAWSPDGRRLAFASDRSGGTDLYLSALDGGAPQRLTGSPDHEVHPQWLTSRHLVFVRSREGPDAPGELRLMDLETRRARTLLEGRAVERLYRGATAGAGEDVLVERVSIRSPSAAVTPGLRTELRAEATTASGTAILPSDLPVSWSVDDTSVARVDAGSGELVVRDTGTVRVTVSAAGWRSDTVTLRSRPVRVRARRSLLREAWSGGVADRRWTVVGAPAPYVTELDSARSPEDRLLAERAGGVAGELVGAGDLSSPARAFVNNGDENYDSGVLSRRAFPLEDGLTVEFWGRMPFTSELFQGLELRLYPPEPGPDPASGKQDGHHLLELGFGADRRTPVLNTAEGSATPLPGPDELDDWHRYAVQVHGDGSVSWVLDGVIRWLSSGPVLEELPDAARLYVGGRSKGTEIQTGPVVVWRGERYVAGGG